VISFRAPSPSVRVAEHLWLGRSVLVVFLLLLASCATDRYAIRQDRAPSVTIRADQVPEAVVRAEPIRAAGNKSPYTVNGKTFTVLDTAQTYQEVGLASWYGVKFHGHLTSNGEIFDMYQPTAAHRTLPIPTFVRVTNLQNQRSMIVRVNDRGPFHSDRIIDLSYGAAVKLGFADLGTAKVRVEAVAIDGVDDFRDRPEGVYRYLQVGAFSQRQGAEASAKKVQRLTQWPVFISAASLSDGPVYRVRIGPIDSGEELAALELTLMEAGVSSVSRIR
jgi:rare lipoprotein A